MNQDCSHEGYDVSYLLIMSHFNSSDYRDWILTMSLTAGGMMAFSQGFSLSNVGMSLLEQKWEMLLGWII